MSIDAPTVARLAELAADAYGPRTALRFKRAGVWHTISYSQLTKAVDAFATGLRDLLDLGDLGDLGVLPGDHVGILSETCHEWTLCDLALARARSRQRPRLPHQHP
ncbi:AMP-binding protein [Streptomyces lunaelactis]|uniref:AMP-binding protein n=1 Tax=Streptomyces lunaelactis TaxID=1535768 RepID=UPI001584FE39|nr:AMP-binding protein [Streptomyces lunaelactis]